LTLTDLTGHNILRLKDSAPYQPDKGLVCFLVWQVILLYLSSVVGGTANPVWYFNPLIKLATMKSR